MLLNWSNSGAGVKRPWRRLNQKGSRTILGQWRAILQIGVLIAAHTGANAIRGGNAVALQWVRGRKWRVFGSALRTLSASRPGPRFRTCAKSTSSHARARSVRYQESQ